MTEDELHLPSHFKNWSQNCTLLKDTIYTKLSHITSLVYSYIAGVETEASQNLIIKRATYPLDLIPFRPEETKIIYHHEATEVLSWKCFFSTLLQTLYINLTWLAQIVGSNNFGKSLY